jgi:hypothetical protein
MQVLLLVAAPALYFSLRSNAAPIRNASVTIGTSVPGANTSHAFRFDLQTANNMGSIEFEYCINGPFIGSPCTVPPGLDLLSANLSSQAAETGFSIHPNSTSTKIIITRAPTAVTPQPVMYIFDNVINPTTPAQSTFVRISTFASDDATGARTDSGVVMFSSSGQLSVGGFVPPFLTFCVGVAVAGDCSSTTGDKINLGELSTAVASTATSQFAGATNDVSGYVVTLLGTTMTSGINSITAIPAPDVSTPGTSQFGINLRANATPAVGQNPIGPGTSTADPLYDTPDQFVFQNGTLTNSSISTDFNTFTVSYIVNVPVGQPPGIYSTTATFLATAMF